MNVVLMQAPRRLQVHYNVAVLTTAQHHLYTHAGRRQQSMRAGTRISVLKVVGS